MICTQGRSAAHLNPGLCKRNSYRVAKGAYLSRWATPSLYAHHTPWANTIPTLGAYRPSWLANNRPNIFDHTHRKIVRTPGNSVRVAIPQPRVEVRSASTLGIHTKKKCNAVSVALSRRRYSQQEMQILLAFNE